MVILANQGGAELRTLSPKKIDVDLGDSRDFQAVFAAADWQDDLTYQNRIFIPGTEYGGIIGGIETDTEEETVTVSGYTWRGVLQNKVISPAAGQSYKVVSGELNAVVGALLLEQGISGLFVASNENTEISVTNYQFDRYCTLLAGVEKMLKSKGYRLEVVYVQQEQGASGYVRLSAVPAVDYSETIEYSQDSELHFTFTQTRNGVNHLVCLGKGELAEREVIHLYVQGDGSISTTTPYYTGLAEIAQTYENTSTEDLQEDGTQKLQELMSRQTFKMSVDSLDFEVEIGDIIGGRDYITGMAMKKPIVNKIYTEENGTVKIAYKVEGDEQ